MDLRQKKNERKYDLAASSYYLIAYIMSLGQIKKIYRMAANKIKIGLNAGIILDVGCGPATVTPYLIEELGGNSKIIGIDFSQEMIKLANFKKHKYSWENTEFEYLDMHDFPESNHIDSILFCLALTAIPNSIKVLEKSLRILSENGKIIIIDSIPLHGKLRYFFTNLYITFKSLIVGAKPSSEILSFLKKNMKNVEVEEMAFGIYSVITATKGK